MIRRIIYILLIILVIILAFLAIRWLLNRGSDGEAATENGQVLVQEEMGVVESGYPVDSVGGGETAVEPAPGGDVTTTNGNGDTPTSSGDAGVVTDGDTAVSDDTAAADTTGSDATAGGVAGSGDPDAGGGVIEPGADAAGGGGDVAAEESADANTSATGMGGQTAVTTVTPGVPAQHVVQQREWLTHLARCYGTTVRDIRAANHIPIPDLIYPGAVFTIPNPGNAGTITINNAPCFVHHTVQQGQNLSQIAQQYGINLHWLARINRIHNYNYVQAGQVLVIPNPVPAELTVAPPR